MTPRFLHRRVSLLFNPAFTRLGFFLPELACRGRGRLSNNEYVVLSCNRTMNLGLDICHTAAARSRNSAHCKVSLTPRCSFAVAEYLTEPLIYQYNRLHFRKKSVK